MDMNKKYRVWIEVKEEGLPTLSKLSEIMERSYVTLGIWYFENMESMNSFLDTFSSRERYNNGVNAKVHIQTAVLPENNYNQLKSYYL